MNTMLDRKGEDGGAGLAAMTRTQKKSLKVSISSYIIHIRKQGGIDKIEESDHARMDAVNKWLLQIRGRADLAHFWRGWRKGDSSGLDGSEVDTSSR